MRSALLVLLAVAPTRLCAAEPDADPLPAGAVARFGSARFQDFTIGGHVAFSPDGKRLATGGANSPVCVWDAATGKLLRTHGPVGSILGLQWKAGGRLAALAFFGHTSVFMHEWADGRDDGPGAEQMREFHAAVDKVKREGHGGQTILSADGHRVVSVWDAYDAKRRAEVFTFAPNTPSALVEPEWSIALGSGYYVWLSRDAKTLIAHVSGKGGEERIAGFDLTRGARQDRPAWEFAYKADGDHRVSHCLSADGKRVVLRFLSGDAELWDGPAGKLIRALPKMPGAHIPGGGEHPGMELSPDGKRLAITTRHKSGEVGGSVIDLDTGKEVVALAAGPTPRLAGGLTFSPDGKRLALTAHGVVRVWNAETGADAAPMPGHRGRINSVVAAPDGKTVVTAGEDFTVRAWDSATGKEKWKAAFPQGVHASFATADAVVLSYSTYGSTAGLPEPLLDLATGKARKLPGAMGEGTKVPATGFGGGGVAYDSLLAIAPDGKSAVTLQNYATDLAKHQTALRVWSWPDGELQKTLPMEVPDKMAVMNVRGRFTPDGKELHTVARCSTQSPLQRRGPLTIPMLIDRWDAAGKRVDRKKVNDVHAVWTADGSRLLLLGEAVTDAFSGEPVVKLSGPDGKPLSTDRWVGGAAISPDGKTLAVADGWAGGGSVRLHDLKTGRFLATLPSGSRAGVTAAFLPDGRLVTAGEAALVWDLEKVKPPEKP